MLEVASTGHISELVAADFGDDGIVDSPTILRKGLRKYLRDANRRSADERLRKVDGVNAALFTFHRKLLALSRKNSAVSGNVAANQSTKDTSFAYFVRLQRRAYVYTANPAIRLVDNRYFDWDGFCHSNQEEKYPCTANTHGSSVRRDVEVRERTGV